MSDETNGWGEWRRHVLLQLESYDGRLKAIETNISKFNTEIAILKFKSSIWGASAGVVGASAVALVKALLN